MSASSRYLSSLQAYEPKQLKCFHLNATRSTHKCPTRSSLRGGVTTYSLASRPRQEISSRERKRLLRFRSAPIFVDQNPEPDPEDDQRLVVRLEDLAEELTKTVHADSTQPDFTVKSLGMLPNGDNADPTVVWLIARIDPESPLGFGSKAAIEDFWQVPDEITEKVFPEAANDMELVKRNLFFKAERANLSNNAAFAIGLFLQTVEMSTRYKLVCGEAEEEVTELLTLNAPRQLPSFLTNPVLIEQAEDGSQESGVKLLTTELSPDLQQTLGMRAAFHRTIAARTASGLFEIDITGSQLDNFQLSPNNSFPYRCEPLEEKALEGWSIPLAEFCKEWPKRLRESTDEEVGEIKGVGADMDIAGMSSSATARTEKQLFQALGWSKSISQKFDLLF